MEERRIGAELAMLNNLIKRQMCCMADCDGTEGVTGMQGMIIHHLAEHAGADDCFQRDIETQFRIRRSTATGILKLMEQHGLLRREPVEYDARLKRLVLTERAFALNDAVHRQLERIERLMQQNVSADDLETWFVVSEQIRANLEQCQCNTSEETL